MRSGELPRRLSSKSERAGERSRASPAQRREGPAGRPPGTAGLPGCERGSAARCKEPYLLAFDLRCRLLTRMQTFAQDESRFVADSPGDVSLPTAATFLSEMSEKILMMTGWQIPLLPTLHCSLEIFRQR